MFARAALTLTILALPSFAQVQPIYIGTGTRYDQQVGAIQRNSTLSPSGVVTIAAGSSMRRVFVRFQADTGRNVTGYDLFLRSDSGPLVTRGSLWDADANDKPSSNLVQGDIAINPHFDWYRASFPSAFRVTGGRLYFMAFDLPAGATVELRTTDSGAATTVAYFTSRTGTAQFAKLMYKVNADGKLPLLHTGPALRGQCVPLDCTGMNPGAFGILWFGLSNTSGDGAPLPVLVGHEYVHGTIQWIAFDCLLGYGVANGSGSIQGCVAYPTSASLIGLRLFGQWSVQIAPNSTRWAMSDAVQVTIQ